MNSKFLISITIALTVIIFYWTSTNDILPIDSSGGESLAIQPKDSLTYFLQNNKIWTNDELGNSGQTIGAVGCTICCVSMSLTQQGHKINPQQLNDLLIKNKGYTNNGWLIWKAISKITNNDYQVTIPNNFTHKTLDNLLKKNIPIIVKVMINNQIAHWVLIVGKTEKDYLIKDPLEPSQKIIKLNKYKSKIYSIRYITKAN